MKLMIVFHDENYKWILDIVSQIDFLLTFDIVFVLTSEYKLLWNLLLLLLDRVNQEKWTNQEFNQDFKLTKSYKTLK